MIEESETMIQMHDDIHGRKVSPDFNMSRWLILLIINVSIFVAILGAVSGEAFFGYSLVFGVLSYLMASLLSCVLYIRMKRVKRYPSIYAALSFLCLGLATYVSGFDVEMGAIFSVGAIAYILIYLTVAKWFDIDNTNAAG